MRKVLVTGGTVFVSRSVAEYFVSKGDDVYVLNRNNHEQSKGVTSIESDRYQLGDKLKGYNFDIVLDIVTYTKDDLSCILDALDNVKDYILLSSSAVYPETLPLPFNESQKVGLNKYWGKYGVGKYEAEELLLKRVPQGYIIRPPYLYGPMNNVYREAFVFECALADRPFYLPKDGNMPLQFFYIKDLCRFIDILLEKHPKEHIFNVGNTSAITISDWVKMCYQIAGKKAQFKNVNSDCNQRYYFSFYDYDYMLDVSKMHELMPETTPLEVGLKESFEWYKEHPDMVNQRPYMDYIDKNFMY